MVTPRSYAVISLVLSSLCASCGGGGGGGSGGGGVTGQGGTKVDLSGGSSVADGIVVDSDLNDPTASYASNDTRSAAQAAPNPGKALGFVSREGYGPDNSRFASEGDEFDAYRVSLAAGQTVTVDMADWAADGASVRQDVDLFLYDDGATPVQSSEGTTAREQIRVETSGTYFVVLRAFAGAGNYTLSIGSGESGFSLTGPLSRFDNFVPGEMIEVEAGVQAQSRTAAGAGSTAVAPKLSLQRLDADPRSAAKPGAATDPWTGAPLDEETAAKAATIERIKAARAANPDSHIEPNYLMQSLATPNDPGYPLQWHYPKISLPAAWDITEGASGGTPVIVAVIDTGVVINHPDLAGQTVPGFDFIRDPSYARDGDGIDNNPNDPGTSPVPGSSGWHGTHVAGTIAAANNNGGGVAGVAPAARIMPLRALGLGGSGTAYDIAQSILFAAGLPNDSGTVPARAADVINMSLGGPSNSQAQAAALNAARNAGSILVAAAGNAGNDVANYPASSPGVFSVSATTLRDQLAPYSSFGVNVDLAAPGGDLGSDANGDSYPDGVLSTVLIEDGSRVSGGYKFLQGTSMASPHVAGVFALMKAANPAITSAQIETLLADGDITDDLGPTGRDNAFGHGVINAHKAVVAAQSLGGGGGGGGEIRLVTSVSRLDFGRDNAQLPLRLEASGGRITGIRLSSSSAWLQISDATVNNNGLDYTIGVDRGALSAGLHSAVLRIDSSVGPTELPVTVDTTSQTLSGDVGPLYYLLIDTETDKVVAQERATADGGSYRFTMREAPAGNYVLIAGSDMDNDGFICDYGEACGGWPSLSELAILEADRDRSGLTFPVGLNSALSQSAGDQRFGHGIAVQRLQD